MEIVINRLRIKLLYRKIALLYTCYIIMQNLPIGNLRKPFNMETDIHKKGSVTLLITEPIIYLVLLKSNCAHILKQVIDIIKIQDIRCRTDCLYLRLSLAYRSNHCLNVLWNICNFYFKRQ